MNDGCFAKKTRPQLRNSQSKTDPEKTLTISNTEWKGISQYVLRFPQYRTLFGPVSISSDYTPVSQQMMIGFLVLGLPSRSAHRHRSVAATVGETLTVKQWQSRRLAARQSDVS